LSDNHRIRALLGPPEPAPLQPPVIQPEAVVIPMQYFDLVALSVTEGKQARSEGVQIEAFLDKRS
jgi:hypothetical protein